MIGAVADDDFGRALLDNLERDGVDHRFVARCGGTGMSVAIFEAKGDYGAVIVSGSNLTLGEKDIAAAADVVVQTAVLLQQNEVPEAANIAAARAVKAAGGRVLLNAAPARKLSDDLIALVDIVIVNAIEAEFLAGVPVVDTLHGAVEAARRLVDLCPTAIVTAGGEGVAYCDRRWPGVRAGRHPGESRQHPWRRRRIRRRLRGRACPWRAHRGGHRRRQCGRGLAGLDTEAKRDGI